MFGIQFFWGWEPPVLILFPGSSKLASLPLWSLNPLSCGKYRQIGRDTSRIKSHGGLHASVVCSLKHAKTGAGRVHQLGSVFLDYRKMLVQLCNCFQKIHLQIMHCFLKKIKNTVTLFIYFSGRCVPTFIWVGALDDNSSKAHLHSLSICKGFPGSWGSVRALLKISILVPTSNDSAHLEDRIFVL